MKKGKTFHFTAVLLSLFSLTVSTAWPQANPTPPPAAAPATPTAAPAAPAGAPAASPSAPAAAPGGAPAAAAAPPPSAPAPLSQADLDQLVAPIALYPDQLLAALLPAAASPLEIVQAARFVKDTNNLSKLDTQPWDNNVKAIARFPDVINQLNDNIGWTSALGDAFVHQSKELMDAVQRMRVKAQQAGDLKTTPQQNVIVTNAVVTNTVNQQVVYVTNQVVQIEPAQPDVVYVPQYNPTVVYGGAAVYPGYTYAPTPGAVAAASVVSFGAGLAVGAIINNNHCDWGYGSCWNGGYNANVNVNRNYNANINRNYNYNGNANINRNYNGNANINRNYSGNANVNRNYSGNANVNRNYSGNANVNGQRWQPNQARAQSYSGSSWSGAQNSEARGWGSANANANRTASAATTRQAYGGTPTATGRTYNQASAQNFSQQRSSAFSGGSAAQTRQASFRGAASRGGGRR